MIEIKRFEQCSSGSQPNTIGLEQFFLLEAKGSGLIHRTHTMNDY